MIRVARFAIPTGIASGLATLAAYELAISESASLNQARSIATMVLSAMGLFALGMVARPLVPWKRGLIWVMGLILALLFSTAASRSFFALSLPRPVVFMAAVGVVAVAGGVMVLGLRSVGWIRRAPKVLRETPPLAAASWKALRERIRLGERIGMLLEPARGSGTITEPPPTAPGTATPDPPPPTNRDDLAYDDALLDIQWFDPDEEYGTGGE